ncbi:arginyl-trna synthetase [hydrocarbon metagenome]|uniref:arginine--tRNA ligase n=1 Tax=hydrocarbon metagenome TaxID=938273 RepID=A0A0W8E4W0_9ZZZZ
MNPIQQLKVLISSSITDALMLARKEGLIKFDSVPDFVIEVPREKGHGDFACNAAMIMAREAKMAPRQIAEIIIKSMELNGIEQLEKVEIAGPGFINIFLNDKWLYEIPYIVDKMGDHFGHNEARSCKVQVEFVSANPTGNLHMGNARGGAIGDTLANILKYDGYQVEREFYINDAGNQIEIFGDSLEARYLQLTGHDVEFPENGYAGQDLIQTVRNIINQYGENLSELPKEKRRRLIIEYALEEKVTYIKKTLLDFGIEYDVWYSEKTLHESGAVQQAIGILQEKGYIYEQEGALWFKTSSSEEDKDNVVMRANGLPTYFAADIAYHHDKYQRGFDWVINVWGADHHGHVNRMKDAIEALGYKRDMLDVLLMQLVRLYRGKDLVRMSKRTGTTIALDELIEELGKDAARFFFVMRSPDSQLDFDLRLAAEQSQENPVYYVQYAHARICSIFRQAAAAGITMAETSSIDTSLLKEPEELALLRKIADFPEEIRVSAQTLAPHRMARYVLDLAGLFHSFYNRHRVINVEAGLQDARLLLMQITGITIKNALSILGVGAPEYM